MTREVEVAWAAGLFEGEGSMSIPMRPGSLRASLSSTDFDVVRRFADVMGVGNVTSKNHGDDKPTHWKPQLRWDAFGADALLVMEQIERSQN